MNAEAKEIFRYYGGSHFHMARDEVYEHYKSFNISKETENLWLEEMKQEFRRELIQKKNMSEIARVFAKYGDMVSLTSDVKGCYFMLDYIQKNLKFLDSNTLERSINSLLDVVTELLKDEERKSVIRLSISMLKEMLIGTITISDDYMENGMLPNYLTVDKIRNEIQRLINYWEKVVQDFDAGDSEMDGNFFQRWKKIWKNR